MHVCSAFRMKPEHAVMVLFELSSDNAEEGSDRSEGVLHGFLKDPHMPDEE